MRKIQEVGVWPVGIVGGMRVEMPLVVDGKVVGFNAVWKPFRPFPIDMAGFAINATLFLTQPDAKFSRKVQSGFQVRYNLLFCKNSVSNQNNSTFTYYSIVSFSGFT